MVIRGLHHVGHVVRDMRAARALYERMGFRVPPPVFPALPPPGGGPPRAFGAGNTHVTFRRNFLELVTVVGDGEIGPEATLVPLEAPPEALVRVTEGITATSVRLAAALARFEGLHILVFETPDADAAAAHLAASGVEHDGVTRIRTADGTPLGFVEIDSRSPEGRLAVAEALPAGNGDDHPNGAFELVGPLLCVADDELDGVERRYARYLGRHARAEGRTRVFDLDGCEVVLVPASALDGLLPGEQKPVLPAFAASVVAVHDLAVTRDVLERAHLPVRATPAGDLLLPAHAAIGAAVIFCEA